MVEIAGVAVALLSIGTIALVYAMLTMGLNVHYGYTGLLNFGHVAFFAAGAYTSALLTVPPPGPGANYTVALSLPMPWGLPVSLVAAALVGGLLATLIGLTSVRLGTHYLAIATFALAGIFEDVLVNEAWLTAGTFGLNSVPRPGRALLGPGTWQLAYFVFALVLTVGVYLVVERLSDAPFGRLLRGVRESEEAAEVLGKDTTRVKLKSFAIGGMIAGLAGGVYAHYVGSVVAVTFVALVTFLVWVALLLGGAGSNLGAVVGAVVLVAFREGTRYLPDLGGSPTLLPSLRFVVIGFLLILVVRFRPAGLFGDPNELVLAGDDE
ncbi:branched-chain amino acid ABC transporter permease [Salinigranum rubrum]|uniref:Branched-chain amino acid ABC transporter permease n=1 Tax=Salinigranum rubrum TaxID=755307 RepID=A0A2I8VNS4_9EURY|nr:branched-chain amino acid ABC transporter permease [Salinigranum rubrum]AUV83545.1 branched-chain amino acid ABC transporter permease [Salinigranum rubrum]